MNGNAGDSALRALPQASSLKLQAREDSDLPKAQSPEPKAASGASLGLPPLPARVGPALEMLAAAEALECDPAEASIEAAADATLESFSRLVNALVAAGRFNEVGRIASIGSALQRVKKLTVQDFLQREREQQAAVGAVLPAYNGAADGGGNGWLDGGGNNYVLPAVGGGGNDAHGLYRDAMLTVEKKMAADKENAKGAEASNAAAVARDEADELGSLQRVIQKLPEDAPERTQLGARVRTLIDNIAKRTTENP